MRQCRPRGLPLPSSYGLAEEVLGALLGAGPLGALTAGSATGTAAALTGALAGAAADDDDAGTAAATAAGAGVDAPAQEPLSAGQVRVEAWHVPSYISAAVEG